MTETTNTSRREQYYKPVIGHGQRVSPPNKTLRTRAITTRRGVFRQGLPGTRTAESTLKDLGPTNGSPMVLIGRGTRPTPTARPPYSCLEDDSSRNARARQRCCQRRAKRKDVSRRVLPPTPGRPACAPPSLQSTVLRDRAAQRDSRSFGPARRPHGAVNHEEEPLSSSVSNALIHTFLNSTGLPCSWET